MGEIHVKDSTNTLREVKKVFVKDSSGTVRGPVRKAFVLDGGNVRDVFTKIETLSVSGAANTLTPAVSEVATLTVNSINNQVTATTYVRSKGSTTTAQSASTSYSNSIPPNLTTYHNSNGWQTNSTYYPNTPILGNIGPNIQNTGTSYYYWPVTTASDGQLTTTGDWDIGLVSFSNGAPRPNATNLFAGTGGNAGNYSYGGMNQATAELRTGYAPQGSYSGSLVHTFSGPLTTTYNSSTYGTSGFIPTGQAGNQYVSTPKIMSLAANITGLSANTTYYVVLTFAGSYIGNSGYSFYVALVQGSMNSSSPYYSFYADANSYNYGASPYVAFGQSNSWPPRLNFTATKNNTVSYNNVSVQSTSSVNGGATFSIGGTFSASGTLSQTNSENSAAAALNTAIQGSLPAGASSSVSNNVITITFAPGAVTDLTGSASNGSASGSQTPADTNGATSTYTPGGTATITAAVTPPGGSNVSGSLTVVPITIGSTTHNISITSGANTDQAGTDIANALNALSGVTASYDSATDNITVITTEDISVGTISNANSLAVSVD